MPPHPKRQAEPRDEGDDAQRGFLGFTGTPLLKKDRQTSLEVFGGYIHTYKFSEAVKDEVVLDLVYEARDIDQRLGSEDKIDAWFEAKTKGLNGLAARRTEEPVGHNAESAQLQVPPGANHYRKEDDVAQWYREQIKAAVPALIAKWEPMVGVNVKRVFVQKMKTKWGSCNPGSCSVRLNTDLAKKPRECLEYILVHEIVHMLEPTHNAHFVAIMDRLMPQWRVCREQLNQLPVCHERWSY